MSETMLYAFCLGDGWLSYSKQSRHDSYYYQIGFSGDELSLKDFVKPDLIKLYGNIGKATIRTEQMVSEQYGIDGTTSQFIANTSVAKRFIELGLQSGKKVETEYKLPEWVMNGSSQIKADFLSGFYAAEGFTPSFQKNNKTLKPLGFRFYKRKYQQKNKDLLVSQWSKLLNDLGIQFTYEETERRTCDDNYVCTFVFSNEHSQIIHQLSILNLKYCISKKEIAEQVLLYYKKKDEVINAMLEANKFALENPNISGTDIGKMFGIDRNQVYRWRSRNSSVRLPSSFMTFEHFTMSLQAAMPVEQHGELRESLKPVER